MKRILLTAVIISIIPSIIIFIGDNNSFLIDLQKNEIIGESFPVNEINSAATLLTNIYILLITPIAIIYYKKTVGVLKEELVSFLQENNDLLIDMIRQKIGHQIQFNLRIFIPRYNWPNFFHSYLKFKKHFKIVEIKGMANHPGIKKIKFEVFPKVEGIVGKCYEQKKPYLDTDVQKSLEENYYNLSEPQRANTQNVRFCMACPAVEEESGEVKFIVSMDSHQTIEMTESQSKELKDLLLTYCYRLQTHYQILKKVQ